MFHPFIPNNVNQDFVAAKYSAVKVSLFQKCKKKKKIKVTLYHINLFLVLPLSKVLQWRGRRKWGEMERVRGGYKTYAVTIWLPYIPFLGFHSFTGVWYTWVSRHLKLLWTKLHFTSNLIGQNQSSHFQMHHWCAEHLLVYTVTRHSSTIQTQRQRRPTPSCLSHLPCWTVTSRCSPYISLCILCLSLSLPELSASTAQDRHRWQGTVSSHALFHIPVT